MKHYIYTLILLFAYVQLVAQPLTLVVNKNSTGNFYAKNSIKVQPDLATGKTKLSALSRLHLGDDALPLVNTSANLNAGFDANGTVNLDYSLPVGATQGSPSVTAMGGASYSIPFDIPKATAGFMPQGLGLSYNSMGTQGIAGLGWNLAGLSAITRSGHNLNDDGYTDGVSITNNDKFMYDGNWLLPIAGNNGEDGTQYHTERESFATIISHTSKTDNSGPEWFEVITKEGLTIEFGSTLDSRIAYDDATGATTKTTMVVWYVSKIKDKQGNYISYQYRNTTGDNNESEIAIEKIIYTGNVLAGITPVNEIKFNYVRSNFSFKYAIQNKLMQSTFLLNKVECKVLDQPYKSYQLNYTKRENWEFLISIQEFNKDNEKLNPTLFNYNEPDAYYSTNSLTHSYDIKQARIFYIDVNNDGYKDLISIQDIRPLNDHTTDCKIYLGDKFGNFSSIASSLSTNFNWFVSGMNMATININDPIAGFALSVQGVNYKRKFNTNLQLGDFNGDGKQDILLVNYYFKALAPGQAFYEPHAHISVLQNNGAGFDLIKNFYPTIPIIFNDINLGVNQSQPQIGQQLYEVAVIATDLNNNGISEIVVFKSGIATSITNVDVWENQLGEFNLSTIPVVNFKANLENVSLQSNNGVQSIVGIKGIDVYGNIINNYNIEYNRVNNAFAFVVDTQEKREVLMCNTAIKKFNLDVNGDGIIDKLSFNNSGLATLYINNTSYTTNTTYTFDYNPSSCNNKFFVADMNSDGKSDVVIIKMGNPTAVDVYISTGSTFIERTNGIDNLFTGFLTNENWDVSFEDLNNDGLIEVILNNKGTDITSSAPALTTDLLVFSFNVSPSAYNLMGVIDGIGKKTNFIYASFTSSYSNYTFNNTNYATNNTNGHIANLPFYSGLKTVRSLQTSNGLGTYFNTEYSYHNPIFNTEGKGFLGFEKTEVNNLASQTKTISTNLLYPSKALLLPFKTETKNVTNTNGIIETPISVVQDIVYDIATIKPTLPKETYLIKNTTASTYNLLNGTISVLTNTIDNNGNLTHSTTNIANGLSTEETTISYNTTLTNTTYPYLPEIITKTVGRNGGTNSVTTYNTYNAQHQLLSTKNYPTTNTARYNQAEYEYYITGNPKKTISKVAGNTTTQTTYTYDPTFTNTLTQTNILGQTTAMEYMPVLNLVNKTTSPTGLVSTATYDGWGRSTSTTNANGLTATTLYNWINTGTIPVSQHPAEFAMALNNVRYRIQKEMAGQPVSIAHFDVLGRKILYQTRDHDDYNYTATAYNYNGLVEGECGNYRINSMNGATYALTHNFYDDLLRPIQSVVSSTGEPTLTTNYDYSYINNEQVVTVVAPDNTVKKTYTDASGKLTKTIDNNNTALTYETNYTTNDNTRTEITKIDGVLATTATFDEIGNQTQLIDAYAGTTGYTYDNAGNLLTQTNPKGTYTHTYDLANRLLTKTGSAGDTYTYSYVPTGNGLNQISSVTCNNGTGYTYTYDNLHRQTNLTETIDPTHVYTTSYEYNNLDQLSRTIYPSGFATKNYYTPEGYLHDIKTDNNTPIWHSVGTNHLGQPTLYQQGTLTTSTNTYSNYGVLQAQITAGIQQMSYAINATNGNMDSRGNLLLNDVNKYEFFTHDPLNRLTKWQRNIFSATPIVNTMHYDNNGKIDYKTDAGNPYLYANNTQLTQIQNPTAGIPLQQQDITYNTFLKPTVIAENNYELTLQYGADQQRNKGVWKQNGVPYRTRYYATNYEINIEAGKSHYIHYINAPTGLCAMYVIETTGTTAPSANGAGGALHYTFTDHLGSITAVTSGAGVVEAKQDFDPWGRRRNPLTLEYYTTAQAGTLSLPKWLYRGYTGHEMLDEFTLINMNARLYDPVVGMMLGPDNYVTDATNTQAYNRYSYVANRPLTYTDPSGNFLVADSWIVGFVHGFFSTSSNRGSTGWNEANHFAKNDARLWGGLFISDPNKSTLGRIGEVASRLTWQLPQTILGLAYAQFENIVGNVDRVDYKYGATVTTGNHDLFFNLGGAGITQGSFIVGNNTMEADANNSLFQHEYGHYLQSQRMGLAYYSRVGIPNIGSNQNGNKNYKNHNYHPTEQDANRRAFLYFNKNVDGFYDLKTNDNHGWDWSSNPLDVNKTGASGNIIDYKNSGHINSLNNLKVSPKWYDYAPWLLSPAGMVIGTVGVGIYNSWQYNH